MTFVVAKCFGERIYIASGTMISNSGKTRPDVIPGRLKVIILDAKTTVAYAGLADQGIDTIKLAKQRLSDGGNLLDVEQILAAATRKYEGQLEFLIASHHDGGTLKRIWDGCISSGLEQVCIGQRALLQMLIKQEKEVPQSIVPHEFEEECRFAQASESVRWPSGL